LGLTFLGKFLGEFLGKFLGKFLGIPASRIEGAKIALTTRLHR
jgi:hypothetical protein